MPHLRFIYYTAVSAYSLFTTVFILLHLIRTSGSFKRRTVLYVNVADLTRSSCRPPYQLCLSIDYASNAYGTLCHGVTPSSVCDTSYTKPPLYNHSRQRRIRLILPHSGGDPDPDPEAPPIGFSEANAYSGVRSPRVSTNSVLPLDTSGSPSRQRVTSGVHINHIDDLHIDRAEGSKQGLASRCQRNDPGRCVETIE